MRASRALALALLLPAAPACSDGVSPASDLQRNRARWAKANVTSYSLVVVHSCDCPPELVGPVTLQVVNGVVQSRAYSNGGGSVPEHLHEVFPTVPGLFDVIESSIGLKPAQIRVTYDPTLGYPTSIFVDFSTQVVDEELSYTATLQLPAQEPFDPAPRDAPPVSRMR